MKKYFEIDRKDSLKFFLKKLRFEIGHTNLTSIRMSTAFSNGDKVAEFAVKDDPLNIIKIEGRGCEIDILLKIFEVRKAIGADGKITMKLGILDDFSHMD